MGVARWGKGWGVTERERERLHTHTHTHTQHTYLQPVQSNLLQEIITYIGNYYYTHNTHLQPMAIKPVAQRME